MTTGHVFIAVSLDGYIARKDHAIDWLEGQGTTTEEHGYTQFSTQLTASFSAEKHTKSY